MKVIFSKRAYASIVMEAEEYEENGIESGGVLLGHISCEKFFVLENINPGYNATHTSSKFMYDDEYINYQATKIANLYDKPLDLVGLWHMHLNKIPIFSKTDISLNIKYAELSSTYMVSGIVCFCPIFKLNVFCVDSQGTISETKYIVDDNEIPSSERKIKNIF